ncbi:MAG: sugar phosphate isomerase/epimerase [Bryobacteraceae bacterium]|nr:sugar phosphate isomerase/epimerase [Bryobacteraceae bacterium]
MTRRTLLTSAAFSGMALTAAAPAPRGKSKIRLGGPVFGKHDDPRELARAHRALGYSAAYCPDVKIDDKERIRAIQYAFKAENVVISEVGAWVNLLDPDAGKRKKNFEYVASRLALAEAVGATCCVDIAGSYNPTVWYGPHPKNLSKEFFDATVENCRKLIDQVKPTRTKFCIEMMSSSVPDCAESYVQLIKAVERKAFGVHIDVCNVISSPARFYDTGTFIRQTIAKLAPWILSCHAKDLIWQPEMNLHFIEVIPGRGSVDYRAYLEALAALPRETPLMLEHLSKAEEYAEGAAYIRKVGQETGVEFV